MSHDSERELVKHRVERLQRRLRVMTGFDGGEDFRIALETELVGTLVEGRLVGLRRGYQAHKDLSPPPRPRSPTPKSFPPPVDPMAETPLRPTDWVNPTFNRGSKR